VLVPRVFIPLAFILLVYEATVPFAAELRDAARASTCESETPSIRAEVSTAGRSHSSYAPYYSIRLLRVYADPLYDTNDQDTYADEYRPAPARMMKTAECDRI